MHNIFATLKPGVAPRFSRFDRILNFLIIDLHNTGTLVSRGFPPHTLQGWIFMYTFYVQSNFLPLINIGDLEVLCSHVSNDAHTKRRIYAQVFKYDMHLFCNTANRPQLRYLCGKIGVFFFFLFFMVVWTRRERKKLLFQVVVNKKYVSNMLCLVLLLDLVWFDFFLWLVTCGFRSSLEHIDDDVVLYASEESTQLICCCCMAGVVVVGGDALLEWFVLIL